MIVQELENIKDKFASPRKTKIIDAVLNYNIEETIQKESVVISITNQGYIKRSPLSSLKAQKKGGKRQTGISTRERILSFKYLQLIHIRLFYSFPHKDWYIKLKLIKFLKEQLHLKGNRFLIYFH